MRRHFHSNNLPKDMEFLRLTFLSSVDAKHFCSVFARFVSRKQIHLRKGYLARIKAHNVTEAWMLTMLSCLIHLSKMGIKSPHFLEQQCLDVMTAASNNETVYMADKDGNRITCSWFFELWIHVAQMYPEVDLEQYNIFSLVYPNRS